MSLAWVPLAMLYVLIAQMTTMVVAAYSCGLAMANMFNIKTHSVDRWSPLSSLLLAGFVFSLAGIIGWLNTFLQVSCNTVCSGRHHNRVGSLYYQRQKVEQQFRCQLDCPLASMAIACGLQPLFP